VLLRSERTKGSKTTNDNDDERGGGKREDVAVVTKILRAFRKLAVTFGERENNRWLVSTCSDPAERVIRAEDPAGLSASYRCVLEDDFQGWLLSKMGTI
jgi:precorrin-2 methylase